MARPVLRAALCLLIGIFAGRILGPLFVPDPTGVLAAGLTVGVTLVVSVLLFRSDTLRERKSVAE